MKRGRIRPAVACLLMALCLAAACRGKGARGRRGGGRGADGGVVEVLEQPVSRTVPLCREGIPAEARQGGRLTVALTPEPPHLQPLQEGLDAIERVVTGLIYEPLVECGPEGVRAALADRWEASGDGLQLTLHLRPDVHFHDGLLLMPADVQASVQAVLHKPARLPVLQASLADIASSEALADRTVRFTLVRRSSAVLRALCDVPILPQALARGWRVAGQASPRHPVGTGPFRFVDWEPGRAIHLARDPAFWRTRPPLDEITFVIEPDAARVLTGARNGEIDVVPHLPEAYFPEQVRPAALGTTTALWRLGTEDVSFIALNLRTGPLADLRVRQALSHLVDRGALAEQLHRGLAWPTGSPRTDDVPIPVFDPAAAGRLLDEGGFHDGNHDGIRERDGVALELTLLESGGRGAAQIGKRLAASFRRAGVDLTLVTLEPAALLERLRAGNFQLALVRWRGRPDEDLRPLFAASGPFNYGGFHSGAAETLLAQLIEAPSPAARGEITRALGTLLANELPALYLFRHDEIALIGTRVHGVCTSEGRLDLRGVWVAP